MEERYPNLFSPITIKNMTIKNRIGMAPMFTHYASESGEVTEKLMDYLTARAKGGVGLIVVENTAVEWDNGRADGNPVTIHNDNYMPGLQEMVKRVHRYGTKIIPELHHAGRQAWASNYDGRPPLAPSAIQSLVGGDMPKEMTEEEIESTIQDFADAAKRTKLAGFDGVGVHAAHGYLISGFISPRTNKRTDKWGGSFENRLRFPVEIVKAIRKEVGPDYPIFWRFSAAELADDGLSLEEGVKYAKALEEAGVDVLDVSYGTYESVEHIPMQGEGNDKLLYLAKAVKDAVNIPVIAVGGLAVDPSVPEKAIADGIADMVHFGRELLAEPNLPNLIRNGELDTARKCIRCSECLGCLDDRKYVHCVINPETGFEYQHNRPPRLDDKRIVVVGAGPAGMEYAIDVAKRGAKVTILEQADKVGGLADTCAQSPYKAPDINRLLDYYKTMLDRQGIDVRLNTPADVETIKALHPDKVFIAMGSTPLELPVEGAENAVSGMDVLNNGVKQLGDGENVLVIGGSGVGLDLAMALADAGKKPTVVEMRDEVGMELNGTLRWHLKDMAAEKGIQIETNTKVIKLNPNEAVVETNGEEKTIPFDSAVYAVGFKRRDEQPLISALEAEGIKTQSLQNINGCGHFLDAIHGAYWAAMDEE